MESSVNVSGVTPHGIRAGDSAALHGLVERRGPAVVAFCTQVCGPDRAATAAAEAFARFRAAVRDTPDLSLIDPEGLLRGATRHSAAAMARVPLGPPPSGRLRSRGTQTCEHVPVMLAARANGALGDADLDRLARHCERCERCAALGEIFRRAELAYADPAIDTLPHATHVQLVEALEAVSAEGLGHAPPPTSAGALPTQITGTLPQLPDLDDEVPLVVEPPAPAPVAVGVQEELEDLEDDDHTYEFAAVAPVAPSDLPVALPQRPPGRARRRLLKILVPLVVLVVAAVAIVLASGVLDGTTTKVPINRPVASGLQAPVTTPLPVTVGGAVRDGALGRSSITTATTP